MSPPPSGSTAGFIHHPGLDPKIWRASAGASVQTPLLGSRVYYFPQGHVEHCCPSLPLMSTSPVLCVISELQLLADPITDEVFAHLVLQPLQKEPRIFPRFRGYQGDVDDNNRVTIYAKTLTPSDANNGGGFSVPRGCAFSVFPPLNFQADPPVQNLSITDMHGSVWEFRHIHRGSPRRHLLTTGWSKFVNSKQLIAGDSVVFMRKSSADEMFIGVRRAPILSYNGEDEHIDYNNQSSGGVAEEDDGRGKKQFRRTGKGRLTAGAVSEAMNKAARGEKFEVVYYPTVGWSEFVVRAEDVDSSTSMHWTPGTRVSMAMETKDSSGIDRFEGFVSCIDRGSPWKQLQITWDRPEIMQNMKRVNPWQVENLSNGTQLHATFPPGYPQTGQFGMSGDDKRYKRGQSSAPPPNLSPSVLSYTTFLASMQEANDYEFVPYNPGESSAAASDPSPLSYTTFPAGMQGARHLEFGSYNPRQSSAAAPDPIPFSLTMFPAGMQRARHHEFGSSNPTRFIGETSPQLCAKSNFFNPLPRLGKVSTEMNFGSLSSDNLSPNSNLSSGNNMVGNRGPISPKAKSIRLFGKSITMQELSESGLADQSGLCEEDDSKESSDNEIQLSLWTHGRRQKPGKTLGA